MIQENTQKIFFMEKIIVGPPKNIYQAWKTKLPGLRQFLAALILALWPKYGLEHHLPSSSRTQISNKAYLHDLNFLPIRTMQGKQSLWNILINCYFGGISNWLRFILQAKTTNMGKYWVFLYFYPIIFDSNE